MASKKWGFSFSELTPDEKAEHLQKLHDGRLKSRYRWVREQEEARRAKIAKETKRSQRLEIRLTLRELNRLRYLAADAETSTAEYIRKLLREAWKEYSK